MGSSCSAAAGRVVRLDAASAHQPESLHHGRHRTGRPGARVGLASTIRPCGAPPWRVRVCCPGVLISAPRWPLPGCHRSGSCVCLGVAALPRAAGGGIDCSVRRGALCPRVHSAAAFFRLIFARREPCAGPQARPRGALSPGSDADAMHNPAHVQAQPVPRFCCSLPSARLSPSPLPPACAPQRGAADCACANRSRFCLQTGSARGAARPARLGRRLWGPTWPLVLRPWVPALDPDPSPVWDGAPGAAAAPRAAQPLAAWCCGRHLSHRPLWPVSALALASAPPPSSAPTARRRSCRVIARFFQLALLGFRGTSSPGTVLLLPGRPTPPTRGVPALESVLVPLRLPPGRLPSVPRGGTGVVRMLCWPWTVSPAASGGCCGSADQLRIWAISWGA